MGGMLKHSKKRCCNVPLFYLYRENKNINVTYQINKINKRKNRDTATVWNEVEYSR